MMGDFIIMYVCVGGRWSNARLRLRTNSSPKGSKKDRSVDR